MVGIVSVVGVVVVGVVVVVVVVGVVVVVVGVVVVVVVVVGVVVVVVVVVGQQHFLRSVFPAQIGASFPNLSRPPLIISRNNDTIIVFLQKFTQNSLSIFSIYTQDYLYPTNRNKPLPYIYLISFF